MLAYRAYFKKLTLSQITVQPNVHITYIKKKKTCQGCKRKRKKKLLAVNVNCNKLYFQKRNLLHRTQTGKGLA